jgi:geranylgeranyl pyrophosphate synthase
VLYGIEQNRTLQELYEFSEPDKDFVGQVVDLLDETGAREYASSKAATYSAAALWHLEAANPAGKAAEALSQLAAMLLQRDY